jgi:hypothetical protein
MNSTFYEFINVEYRRKRKLHHSKFLVRPARHRLRLRQCRAGSGEAGGYSIFKIGYVTSDQEPEAFESSAGHRARLIGFGTDFGELSRVVFDPTSVLCLLTSVLCSLIPDCIRRKYCRSQRGKPGRAALLARAGILAVKRTF